VAEEVEGAEDPPRAAAVAAVLRKVAHHLQLLAVARSLLTVARVTHRKLHTQGVGTHHHHNQVEEHTQLTKTTIMGRFHQ
jgi:hypothetical protein